MGSAAVQGRLWSMAPHDWAELQEPASRPLWETLLTVAGVGPQTRLLDAGCGAGGASRLAAQRGAGVNGLDAAPGLLAIARQRVPDADFYRGDLAALPYPNQAFDVIIAADVLPYVAHPLRVLRELQRVCAPQGCLVVAVWAPPAECAQHAVVAAVRDLLARPLDGEPFALSAPGVLEALLAQAGLSVRSHGTVECVYEYADREMAWQAQASSGSFQAALRVVGTPAIKATVLAALAPYTTPAGTVQMTNYFRYLTGVPAEIAPGVDYERGTAKEV